MRNYKSEFLGICFSQSCKDNKQKDKAAELAAQDAQTKALLALSQPYNSPSVNAGAFILGASVLIAIIAIAATKASDYKAKIAA